MSENINPSITLDSTSIVVDEFKFMNLRGAAQGLAAGQQIDILVTHVLTGESVFLTATLDAEGNFELIHSDLNSLLDGQLLFEASVVVNDETIFAPVIEYEMDADVSSLSVEWVFHADTGLVDIIGVAADVLAGTNVTLVVTDSTGQTFETTAMVNEDGSFSAIDLDLSYLEIGNVSIDAQATDNNDGPLSASTTGELIDTHIVVDLSVNVLPGDIQGISIVGFLSGLPSGTTVFISVWDDEGTQLNLTASTQQDGSYSLSNIDVNIFTNPHLQISAVAGEGNAMGSANTEYDLVMPPSAELSILEAFVSQDLMLSGVGQSTGFAEGTEVTVHISGTKSGYVSTMATIKADGSFTLTGVNVANMPEGMLHITATAQSGITVVETLESFEVDLIINVAPEGQDQTVSGTEDVIYTLSAADFNFTDADNHSFTSVKITSLPTKGLLKLNGVNVQLNAEISKADLEAGKLTFQGAQDGNGDNYTSLKFAVQDSGATHNQDLTPNTLTFNLAAVNDAPTVAHAIPNQTAAYNTAFSYTVPADTFADVDLDTLTYTATLADGSPLPAWLSFDAATRTLTGTPVTTGDLSVKVVASDGTMTVGSSFQISMQPAVKSLSITGATGIQASTLNADDTVTVTVIFSESVNVTGTPQLALNIGGTAVQANYASGSGSNALTFTYKIVAGQNDGNGISIDANALTLNGGTIKDSAGQAATLSSPAVTDNAGYLVDTSAPNTPTMNGGDDVGTITGVIAASGQTDDNKPTLSGSAEAGSVVKVYDGANLLGTTTASGTGAWSFTPASALIDGAHSITATATDSAGNTSPATSALAFTVDTAAPAIGTLSIIDTGASATDGITKNGTVTVGGLEAGATWEYSTDGGSTWKAGTGTSFTLPAATYAANAIQMRETDAAGNLQTGTQIAKITTAVTVDTTAPTIGTLSIVDTGASSTDGITNNGVVTVGGLEAGATWQYSTDAGVTWNNGTGTSFTLPAATYAANAIQMRETDVAGNVQTGTQIAKITTAVTVDTTAPTIGTLSIVDTGSSTSDGITNNGVVTVGGLEAGATWEYSTDGGTTWKAGTGTTFTLAAATYAANAIQMRETDAAGNVQSGTTIAKITTAVTVDTTAPTIGTLTITDTGASSTDGITNNGVVTVGGLEAGATWQYSTDAGVTWNNGTGTSFTLPAATYAANAIQMRETDAAGNVQTGSLIAKNAAAFTVDTTAPAVATLSYTDTGSSSTDGITNNTTITVSGLESGATWQYSKDGGVTWTNGSGTSFDLGSGQGTYAANAIQLRETDVAGNVQTGTQIAKITTAITVDTTAPTIGTLTITDTGASATDGITNNGVVTVGSLEAAATWQYSTDAGVTWNNGTGSSFTLAAGTYAANAIQMRETDKAGNVQTGTQVAKIAGAVTVDTTAPSALTLSLSQDTGTSGTDLLTNNARIKDGAFEVYGGLNLYAANTVGAVLPGLTSVAGLSAARISGTLNGPGVSASMVAKVVAEDTSVTGQYTAWVMAYDGGSYTKATQIKLVEELVNGQTVVKAYGLAEKYAVGDRTNDASFTFSSWSNNDTAYRVYELRIKPAASTDVFEPAVGNTVYYNIDGAGFTATSYTAPTTDGTHTVQMRQNDAAGNITDSNVLTFTVDATAPTIGTLSITDTGSSTSDGITNNGVVTVGSLETDATWEYSTDGGTTWKAGTGTSFTLAAGTYAANAIQMRETDKAGNVQTGTQIAKIATAVTVDTTAPSAPSLVGTDDVGTITGTMAASAQTDDTKPTFSGTAEANTVVKVYDGTTLLGTTTASGTGAWSFTPATALTEGAHSITATATDAAGNASPATSALAFTVDTTAPATTVLSVALSNDTGTSNTDFITSVASQTLSGSLSANLATGEKVMVSLDNGSTWTAATGTVGSTAWSLSGATLNAGNNTLLAKVVDAAGNGGTALSKAYSYVAVSDFTVGITRIEDNAGTATNVLSGGTSNDTTPTLVGTLGGATQGAALATNEVVNVYRTPNLAAATVLQAGSLPNTQIVSGNLLTHYFIGDGNYGTTGNVYLPTTPGDGHMVVFTKTANWGLAVYAGTTLVGNVGTANVPSGGQDNLYFKWDATKGQWLSGTNALTKVGTATVTTNAAGQSTWTLTDATVLGNSDSVNYIAQVENTAGTFGQQSTSGALDWRYNVDAVAPASISLSAADDVANITGTIAANGVTNDNKPTFSGTTEANATVSVYDGTTLVGTTTANGSGAWSFTPTTALTDATHSITAKATDAFGNTSTASTALSFTVDTAAPSIGTLSITDTGASTSDGITNNGVVTVGSLEAGATWQYSTDGGVTWNTGTGTSFTLAAATYAANAIQMRETDAAGNVQTGTQIAKITTAVTVDTTAPTIGTLTITDTGASTTDGITNNGVVTVGGLESGATWQYSTDAGVTWNNGTGTSFTLAAATYAANSIQMRETDAAGNVQTGTQIAKITTAVTVDTTAPTIGTLSIVDTGASATDGITKNGVVTVGGLESGATWQYSTDNGVTWNAGTGTSFTLPAATYAANAIQMRETDVAGNVQTGTQIAKITTAVTVDTTAPTVGTLSIVDTGASSTDGITNNGVVTVGSLETDATWEYSTDGGTTWKAGTGTSFTLPAATYAANAIQMRETDAAGNVQTGTQIAKITTAVTVDTTAPTIGTLTITDTGASATDGITNNGVVTVGGLEAGATWQYSTDAGVTWNNGTGTSFTLAAATYAANAIQMRETDVAGNVQTGSLIAKNAAAFTVDTTAPAVATLSYTDTGSSSTDGITNNTTITVSGLESGATWQYSKDGGVTWTNGSGTSFDLGSGQGTYAANAIQLRETDVAGNVQTGTQIAKITTAVTVDTTAPSAVADIQSGTENSVTLTGNVSTNDTNKDGSEVYALVSSTTGLNGTLTFNADGSYSYARTANLDAITQTATETFTYKVTDKAGNTSQNTLTINLAPQNDAPVLADTALSLSAVLKDSASPVGAVGVLVSTLVGGVSDADASAVKGIAITATNSTNGTLYYSLDGGANWSSLSDASEGNARLLTADANHRVYYMPKAGTTGATADALTFRAWDTTTGTDGLTADTTTNGGTTAFSTATDKVSAYVVAPVTINAVSTDNLINGFESVVISGKADPNAVVSVNTGTTGTATADASGNWEYTVPKIPVVPMVRYVMVRDTLDGSGGYSPTGVFDLSELKVMQGANDLASGKPVSISWATGQFSTVTDGNAGSYLEAGGSGEKWVQLDLGNDYRVDSIGVGSRYGWPDRLNGAKIYTSLTDMSQMTSAQLDAATTTVRSTLITGAPWGGEVVSFQQAATDTAYFKEGVNAITATEVVSGVTNQASRTVTFDSTAPSMGTLSITDTGASSTDGITNNGVVTVGSLETDATWEYSTDGGTTWSNGTGTSFTLAAGTYAANAIQMRETDKAGNVQTGALVAKITGAITVDTTQPTAVADTNTGTEDSVTLTGNVGTNDTSTDGSETFALVGSGTGLKGTLTLNTNGSYTYTRTANLDAIQSAVVEEFTYKVTDKAGNSTQSTLTLQLDPVNDAAVITGDLTNKTLTETNDIQSVSGSLTITDVDSTQAFVPQTATWGANRYGQFSLTSEGAWTYTLSSAQDQFVLGQDYSDSFTVTAADGTTSVVSVTISGTNDAPVVLPRSSTGIWSTYIENTTGILISNGTLLKDDDASSLTGATVQIDAADLMTGDVLGYSATYTVPAGITVTYTASSGLLQLQGVATKAAYADALKNIQFSNSTENPSGISVAHPGGISPSRAIKWQLDDGQSVNNLSEMAYSSINIDARNDTPTLTVDGFSRLYTENTAAMLANNSVVLGDADSIELVGATVKIIFGLTAGDVLGFTTIHGITGSYASGVLTLTGVATVAQYQEALRTVTFVNPSDALTAVASKRTIQWQVNDGSASSNLSVAQSTTISMIAKNDAPLLDATAEIQMTNVAVNAAAPVNGQVLGTRVIDLLGGITDPDGAAVPKGIVVMGMNRDSGTGYYTLDNGVTWNLMDKDISVSPGSGRMLPATASTRVYYVPNAGFVGTVSDAFTYKAWDQTGSTSTNSTAAGKTVGVTYNGGQLPFSEGTDTISVDVQPFQVGTTGNNTLTGTAQSETFIGNGGTDQISAGAGNDTVVMNASNVTALSAVNTALADGGTGVNVFKLDGAGIVLDFTNTTVNSKVNNFSVVDVKGTGNNTIKLALQDVLDMGAVANNTATSVNETDMLVVKGDAGDVLQLKTGSGWTQLAGQSGITLNSTFGAEYGFEAGHTYSQYTQGTATLFVDELMTRSMV